MVAYEANGKDAKTLDYQKLVGLLVEAVKEQQGQIKKLQDKVSVLEKSAGFAH